MKNQNNIDLELQNSYLQLPEILYTKTRPTRVKDPKLIIFNKDLASLLGLDEELFQTLGGVEVLAGNKEIHSSTPIAQAYAGHQFGYFTILGDGRAILLGEYRTKKGETYDIQLKGSGKTPYSRGGDGRAALGPMLREYIISEAMFALGIPTTRSLAVVTTGEQVIREQILEGAILTRLAKSHIRVGTFEYVAAWGSEEELRELADYTIKRHDQEVIDGENPYLDFLNNVIDRQAKLIAKWQLVGFVHGVMNTDNMTISGETIDYGPCAFIDIYDPKTVFSSIDREGRYAFGNQPSIGGWNLARFAETLIPLLDKDEKQAIQLAEEALSKYDELFGQYFLNGMRAKLGLLSEEAQDSLLISELLSLMNKYKFDYTNTFIALTFDKIDETALGNNEDFKKWHNNWHARRKRQGSLEDSFNLMRKNNPAVIPRNHLVEEALAAAVEGGDFGKVEKLLDVLSEPYAHTEEQVEYREVPKQGKPYVTFCGT